MPDLPTPPVAPRETTPTQRADATRLVLRHAHDQTDAGELLDILGLNETTQDGAR